MTKKRKPTLGKAFINLIFGIPSIVSLAKRISALITYEVRLARKSFINMIILAVYCLILIASSWLCLLALLFVYLISISWTTEMALLTLLSINLVMLLIVYCLLKRFQKRLSFPKTRYLLKEVHKIYEEL
jgi:hypothetical protein